MGDYVVIRADLIADLREARRYYEERLRGMHVVTCQGREATLFFDKATNHTYTEKPTDSREAVAVVRTRLSGGAVEERVFCLDRAHLMDAIIPAICSYSYAMQSEGPPNAPRQLVHGQRLKDGRYLRVVLRADAHGLWHCLSAYPIDSGKWLQDRGAARKFPP